jgi:hypothetical protein
MVASLFHQTSSTDIGKLQAKQKANKVVGQINGLTSSTISNIWELRKEKLQEKQNQVKPSSHQTHIDHARILSQRGLLTGNGVTGTMTIDTFLLLPKKQQINKTQKALRLLNGIDNDKFIVHHLPQLGDMVRTYYLTKNNTCETEAAVISGYTTHPNTPYELTNLLDHDEAIETNLATLIHRTAKLDRCTQEEEFIKDQFVQKYFVPDDNMPHTLFVKQPKRTKHTTPITPFTAEVNEIYRDGSLTWAELIYNDLDTESLPFHQLLTSTAFHKDPNKALRMALLKEESLSLYHNDQLITNQSQSPLRKAVSKKRKTTNKNQSVKETTFWNWRRPKFFSLGDSDQQDYGSRRRTGQAGGPGLPSGTVTGVG